MLFISTFCFVILSILSETQSYHWDGNAMYDLEYQGIYFDAEAASWTSSMTLVTSGVETTQCGPNRVLGGYNIMGGSSWDFGTWSRTYTDLPAHNTIYFKGRFYMIDNWEGSSDHFHLGFDSFDTIMWWINSGYASATGDQWGNPTYSDLDPMMVYFTVPHTASSLTFYMANHFSYTSDTQSVGFRDITMTFVTEATVPSASYCGVSGGWALPSNICGCGTGTTMIPTDSGICLGCDSSCLTCNGGTSSDCTSCASGQYLASGTCSSCDSSCLTCNGAGRIMCTTCQSPLILASGSCCDASCTTCSGTGSTDCTSCAADKYLDNGSCYSCDSSCLTCHGAGQTGCTTCQSPLVLVSGSCCDVSCTTCSGTGPTDCTSCSNGMYLSGGACYSCDSSCLTCNGAGLTECTTCQSPLVLVSGSCCDVSCTTCSGTGPTDCSSCANDEYLSGGSCSQCDSSCLTCNAGTSSDCTSCGNGEYLGSGTCYACDSSCITCSGAGSFACTSCNSLEFLVSGACVPCDSSCLTCGSGPTICATCASKKYLSGTNSCQDCDTVCAECSGASNQCTSCVTGYYNYWNGSCLSTCDSPLQQMTDSTGADFCSNPCGTSTNYLYQNRSCLSICPSPLSVVANPGVQYCLSLCSSGHFLYENKTCLSSCLSPFVQRSESYAQYCDSPCDPGIFWYKNASCLPSCPAPYVQTPYSGVLQCLPPCPDSEYFYEYESECSSKCESPFKIKYSDVIKICYSDVQISLAEVTQVQDAAASIQSQGAMASGGMKAASAMNSGSPSSALLAGLSSMLQYIRYMKINYPPKVQMLFLVSAGDPISLGFNFDIPSSVGKELADNTLPDVFEKYDINSNFVYNLWDSLMTLLVVLVVIGILSIVKFVVPKEKYPRIFLMLSKILGVIRWNIPIMLVCSSSGDIFFYASLQIRSTPLDSLSAIICFCVSLVMMLIVFVILMIGFKILKAFGEHKMNPNWAEKWKGYGILYEEYEEESIWSLSYMILFLIRGIVFNLTLANLFNFPLIQCVIINVSNLLMLGYLLYLRPLKNLLNLVQLFVNEGLVNIIGVSILILAIMDKAGINGQSTRVSVGDAIYFVIKIFNTFGLVFMGLGLLVLLISLYKVWRHLKAQKINSPLKIFKAMVLGEAVGESQPNPFETNEVLKRARIRKQPRKQSIQLTNQTQKNGVIYIEDTELSRVQMFTMDLSRADMTITDGFTNQDFSPKRNNALRKTVGSQMEDISDLQISELDISASFALPRGDFRAKEENNPSSQVSQIMNCTVEDANIGNEASDIQETKSGGFIQKWGKLKGYLKSRKAPNMSLGQEQEKEKKEEAIEEKREVRGNPQKTAEFIKNWGRLKGRINSKKPSLSQVEKFQITEVTENPQQKMGVGLTHDWENLRLGGSNKGSNK